MMGTTTTDTKDTMDVSGFVIVSPYYALLYSCIVDKRCPKLDDPENGKVKITSLKPGGKAIYSCDTGYELEGYTTIRICQKNGQWSGKAPVCARKSMPAYNYINKNLFHCFIAIDCGPPPQPDVNGQVQYTGTLLGDTARYTCNEGYELEGEVDEVIIECLNTGDWSGPAPACNRKWTVISKKNISKTIIINVLFIVSVTSLAVDCGAPPAADDNGDVAVDETTFRKTAIYTCDYGYLLRGGSQQIYCQADETWSGTPPDCVRK